MAKFIMLFFFVLIAGGLAYLALSDVPAPSKPVEKPIAVERYFSL